jgi:hypothetical protein
MSSKYIQFLAMNHSILVAIMSLSRAETVFAGKANNLDSEDQSDAISNLSAGLEDMLAVLPSQASITACVTCREPAITANVNRAGEGRPFKLQRQLASSDLLLLSSPWPPLHPSYSIFASSAFPIPPHFQVSPPQFHSRPNPKCSLLWITPSFLC